MKFTKKRAVVVSLAVSLVAILSFSTLAWFNAKDEITNRFMIADSDGDGTPDFSVEVWEGDASNKDLDGMEYENILPGDVIEKNPTVENTGDYDQWIRVKVTFDEYSKIKAACDKYNSVSEDLRYWLDVDSTAWTKDTAEPVFENDTVTYTYYFDYKLAKDQTAVLFNTVTIPGEFVQDDMKFASGDFSITVKAEAIQADNTGDTAQEAFANCWSY